MVLFYVHIKKQMPPKLVHHTNPDKPYRREHNLQPGIVSRIFACGPPDSGKRSALLNIMANEPGGWILL